MDFNLKKNRVKVAVADEARYKSMAGDPLSRQEGGASDRLAQLLNKKIVKALNVTPQTRAVADWSGENNPLTDIGKAVAAIRPYKANGVVMGTVAFANYVGNASIANFGSERLASLQTLLLLFQGTTFRSIPLLKLMPMSALTVLL